MSSGTRKPPIGPKGTHPQQPQPPSSQHLEIVGHASSEAQLRASPFPGSPRKSSVSEPGGADGRMRPRSPKPLEVRRMAEVEGAAGPDHRGLAKIKVPSVNSPISSPARPRALSALAPPNSSPMSPGRGSILANPSVRGRTEDAKGDGPLMPVPPNVPLRKVTSAPDSQSAYAQQNTSIDPWKMQDAALTSAASQPQASILSMRTSGSSKAAQVVPDDGPPASFQYQRRDSTSSTDSPGVYDSPRAANFRSVGRMGSPHSPPTPTSVPHTPTGSTLRPRPPGEAPQVAAARHSRRLSHLASPAEQRSAVARMLLPSSLSAGGATQQGAEDTASGRSNSGGYNSLPGTPSSRPGSGRARPVQALVDAVRSRDDAKLTEALKNLTGPQGNILGLSDRHAVTGRTPLHEAVVGNSHSMVAALLAAGANPNIGHATAGPPLLHAAAFGETAIAEQLLQVGADVQAADIEGFTALHFACKGEHMDMVRLLIRYGADMRVRNVDEQAPFDLATPDMVRALMAAASAADGSNVNSLGAAMRALNGARLVSNGSGGGGGGGSGTPGAPPYSPTARRIPPEQLERPTSAGLAPSNSGNALGGQPAAAFRPVPPGGTPSSGNRPRSGSRRTSRCGDEPPGAVPALAELASPLRSPRSDTDTTPPPPPKLELPTGVQKQLSRPAGEKDILNAFQEEDRDLIRKSQSGAAFSAAMQQHKQHQLQHPHHQQHQPAATAPAPAPALNGKPPVPAPGRPQSGKAKEGQDAQEPPQQELLPFNVPEAPRIRFGVQILVGDNDPSTFGAPPPVVAFPSFSVGVAPGSNNHLQLPPGPPAIRTGAPAQGQPVQPAQAPAPAPAAAPVPAVGFTPPPHVLANGAAANGNPPAAAGGPQPGQLPLPPMAAPPPQQPRVSNSGSSGFGISADIGDAPPLMRDSSPVRSRDSGPSSPALQPSGKKTSGMAGGGYETPKLWGPHGGGGAPDASGSGPRGGHHTLEHSIPEEVPPRISMAVQALRRISATNVSTDAIEVRAAAMFRQSHDVTTGPIAWTQGELLGEGAYGKVYAGLNQHTGELMAVKVLELVRKNGAAEMNPQLLELQSELDLYKKLKHKHVVGYIDAHFDTRTATLFIFLEYVPGGSIASMLQRFGRFSEDLVRNYTRQLLEGLDYLHDCRIVHRDLKGGNVLVSRDGVVKLADFGASKAHRDTTITDCMKSVRGSVFWMAPEIIRGTGYGRRADIWSLGCTVIEMLTGKHPWPQLENQWTAIFTIAKCEEGPPRPKGISEQALRFLDRCLQFDPKNRPSAAELLSDPFVAQRSVASRVGDTAGPL